MREKNQSLIKHMRPEFTLDFPSAIQERLLPQNHMTIGNLWRTLVKRKYSILGVAAIVFGLVAAYTFSRTPIYEGVARLQIDPTRSTNLGLDGDKSASGSPDADSHVKTEVAIIQSDTV